jgi:hypothetical protein
MRVRILALISVALSSTTLGAPAVRAQTAADSAGIRAAALDYIEGWYTADAPRMQRALHPELAKRVVVTDSATGKSQLGQMGAMTLIEYTRNGGGRETPPGARRKDVSILDVFRGAASAKIVAADWIDYLHLARWSGRWVIVNVLWEPKASSTKPSTKPSK